MPTAQSGSPRYSKRSTPRDLTVRTRKLYDASAKGTDIISYTEAALEAGIQSTDAVKIALGIYKEVDVLARDTNFDPLTASALRAIVRFCCAILRSGSTFSSYEIATRAINTWRMLTDEARAVQEVWSREAVSKRLKLKETRTRAQQKMAERHAKELEASSTLAGVYTRTGYD